MMCLECLLVKLIKMVTINTSTTRDAAALWISQQQMCHLGFLYNYLLLSYY